MYYPLLMDPYFRHGASTPWGGGFLKDILGKRAPEDGVGESLEASALPGLNSLVRNGEHTGKSLAEMNELWGAALSGVEGEFPLLVKLLDAQSTLSVQVHPGDDYAIAHEGKPGKTEAWVILSADSDSRIAYGVNLKGESLETVVAEGRIERVLNWESVQPGEVYYIPHGLIHALGAGTVAFEVQQPSDVTYRFYDWGRIDDMGNARELHTKQALDVTEPDLKPSQIGGATLLRRGGSQTYYVSDGNFELSRLNVSGKMPLDAGRMAILTTLGECTIRYDGGEISPAPFDTLVIPAALTGVTVEGNTRLLMCRLPAEGLKDELGYRAENVAGLT